MLIMELFTNLYSIIENSTTMFVTPLRRRLNNNRLKAIPDNFVTSSASLLRL